MSAQLNLLLRSCVLSPELSPSNTGRRTDVALNSSSSSHRGRTRLAIARCRMLPPTATTTRFVEHNSFFLLHDILEGLCILNERTLLFVEVTRYCCVRRHRHKIMDVSPEKRLSPTDFRGLRKNLGLNQIFEIFGNFGKLAHSPTCLAPWPWQRFL